MEMWEIVEEAHEKQTWKPKFPTFQAWVDSQGISRPRSYQLIDHAKALRQAEKVMGMLCARTPESTTRGFTAEEFGRVAQGCESCGQLRKRALNRKRGLGSGALDDD